MSNLLQVELFGLYRARLLHACTKLVPVYWYRKDLTVKPSFIIVLELTAELNLSSEHAQNIVINWLIFILLAVITQAFSVVKTISSAVEAIYACAQSAFLCLEIPRARIEICQLQAKKTCCQTSCTRRTQWKSPTPMLKRTHALIKSRWAERRSHLSLILRQKQTTKTTTTHSPFSTLTLTQRQRRLEKIRKF